MAAVMADVKNSKDEDSGPTFSASGEAGSEI